MIEEGDPIWTLNVVILCKRTRTTTERQATAGGGLATHTTWPDRPYYWTSDTRGSQCLRWRQQQRPFSSKAVGSYAGQIEETLASFTVARRDMAVREDSCADYKLETAWMGGRSTPLR